MTIPIANNSDPPIKLRIMTLQEASLKGDEKCKVVAAIIPPDAGQWGTMYIGPVITSIRPEDRRQLEWGEQGEPSKKLAPYDDVVPVEAFD